MQARPPGAFSSDGCDPSFYSSSIPGHAWTQATGGASTFGLIEEFGEPRPECEVLVRLGVADMTEARVPGTIDVRRSVPFGSSMPEWRRWEGWGRCACSRSLHGHGRGSVPDGRHPMTCYMIRQEGEPVAIVADPAMARAIVRCRPWGEYLVETIEVGEPIPVRRLRARRPKAEAHPDSEDRRRVPRPARRRLGLSARSVDPRPRPSP